ncbi:MAG: UbiA-like polyprenyltransferase [Chthoniobacterales bacterium]
MLGRLWNTTVRVLRLVRFSHTIFALPFALGSMMVAAKNQHGWPGWRLLSLILICMVLARTAAMIFNRVADWQIDQKNPRTAARHQLLPRPTAIAILLACAAGFVATTWRINPLCFYLSPVALGIIFLYSLTKRFTHFTQLFLGLALAVAPVGAWLAVTGAFAWPPLILAAGVLFWVAGFDLIYATQDVDFDRHEGLHSMVVWLGVDRSLWLALLFHVAMWILLGAFAIVAGLGPIFGGALVLIAAMLVYEHRVAATRDLARINDAFFKANAIVGLLFVSAILLECVRPISEAP